MGGVPALVCSEGDPLDAAKRGTVLLLHGLGANKEGNTPELIRLAEAGFLAVAIDLLSHGERRDPTFDLRFGDGAGDRERHLIDAVCEQIRELPTVLGLLHAAGLARPERTGVLGISFGGFVAYGALPSKLFAAAVCLISAPIWPTDAPEHPVRHLDGFFPTALLSQVAVKDALVPAAVVRQFHEMLSPRYLGASERLRLIEYPESEHHMRPEDWEQVMQQSVDWFDRHLPR